MASVPYKTLRLVLVLALLCQGVGCHLVLPEVTHQPLIHNPFPQLSRVAVAPFFNQSGEPTVDGRQFAEAYFAELQETPGFEVVPVHVTEKMIVDLGLNLASPDHRRQLCQTLGVDALVVGSVTDYTPYYPPRCGMRVDWFAANAGFHPIPPGYGLPWGTPQEEYIPSELVFEAEMALAREQLDTQTPEVVAIDRVQRAAEEPAPFDHAGERLDPFEESQSELASPEADDSLPAPHADGSASRQATFEAPIEEGETVSPDSITTAPHGAAGRTDATIPLPMDWPDARGFTPPGPSPVRPRSTPYHGPIMTHTRVFRGNDADFTAALASYVGFQDEARFGGWESYLDRSDDFIRFCCHLHLVEMLSARGGGGETRVVRSWSDNR